MSIELIRPAHNLKGSLTLPGDKSISHRYAMLAGLAEGTTRLTNFSTGADPHSTLSCMAALGAAVQKVEDGIISVTGTGGRFQQPHGNLDCGNSGSTMRMLAGLVASHPHTFTLTGDASLSARPMERIRKPLAAMGANIELTGVEGAGHAPIQITGQQLNAIDFTTPIPSAQVKTAVLFAGLQAEGTTSVSEAIRTRDHTEHALRAFGAEVTRTGVDHGGSGKLSVRGGQQLRAVPELTVPGDISSAAFFLAATVLFPETHLVLDALGMNPTRSVLLDVIASLGAKIRVLSVEELHGELIGTLQINSDHTPRHRTSEPTEISGALAAQLIDEIPVLAAVAPYTRTGIRIRDASELRVKESDRIDLVARNLRAMGAQLTEYEDGLDIAGGQQLHGAVIDSGHDHRIAMAFSIAALRASGDTEIQGAEAASISFPEFFRHLDQLAVR